MRASSKCRPTSMLPLRGPANLMDMRCRTARSRAMTSRRSPKQTRASAGDLPQRPCGTPFPHFYRSALPTTSSILFPSASPLAHLLALSRTAAIIGCTGACRVLGAFSRRLRAGGRARFTADWAFCAAAGLSANIRNRAIPIAKNSSSQAADFRSTLQNFSPVLLPIEVVEPNAGNCKRRRTGFQERD